MSRTFREYYLYVKGEHCSCTDTFKLMATGLRGLNGRSAMLLAKTEHRLAPESLTTHRQEMAGAIALEIKC